MSEPEYVKRETRHMIKSVGHAELEDMFVSVLVPNYTPQEARALRKRANRRGVRRLRYRIRRMWHR